MKCLDFRLLISLYLDDLLSDQERLEFENHFNECMDCKEELELYCEVQKKCKESFVDIEVPNSFHLDLMCKIGDISSVKISDTKGKKKVFTKYMYTAASLIMMLFVVHLVNGFDVNTFKGDSGDEWVNNLAMLSVVEDIDLEIPESYSLDKAMRMESKVALEVDVPFETESTEDDFFITSEVVALDSDFMDINDINDRTDSLVIYLIVTSLSLIAFLYILKRRRSK
ncbi:putative zinc finger protein [Natranaerovirga pectinivora]|uniref:Anti-sigma-W factor RsiW n=1 Tax=Natranaerovirga pectinivora TaxID=682400 RepID=A0A4V2V0P3_9FIRM|nr:zf-HC2 domain-containing protein [Natranaerovirga pectinivora]TCT17099.1 putative zinc finger protein [Natranaerovirga pectinivora]